MGISIDAIIMLAVGAGLSFLSGLTLAKIKKSETKAKERHKEDVEREVLICSHKAATSVLLLEVVEAVQKGKVNGEVTDAKNKFEKVHDDYLKFVMKRAGQDIAK